MPAVELGLDVRPQRAEAVRGRRADIGHLERDPPARSQGAPGRQQELGRVLDVLQDMERADRVERRCDCTSFEGAGLTGTFSVFRA